MFIDVVRGSFGVVACLWFTCCRVSFVVCRVVVCGCLLLCVYVVCVVVCCVLVCCWLLFVVVRWYLPMYFVS